MPQPASPDRPLLDGTAEVLDAVRLHGCRSRAEIVERTGLTRMMTTQRVQQLLELGLLEESGLGSSAGGRRPRQLRFQPDGHLLVADIGWTSIDVGVTDLNGRPLAHLEEETDVTAGPEAVLDQVDRLFTEVSARCDPPGPLRGVGAGIPAPVEFPAGRAVAPSGMPTWDGYPVRERLAERHGVACWVDNDVNVMMLGEYRDGAARGHRNAILAKLGTGIGISLISDDHLHRGAQGCAGRIGNLLHLATAFVQPGLPYPGEVPGTWTAAVLADEGRRLAESGDSPWLKAALDRGEVASARLVAEAAGHGDPASVELLRRTGALIGSMLAAVISLLNPSVLVLAGGLSRSGDFFLAAIREAVHGQAVPLATRDLRISEAALGTKAGVVGAAAMVLDQLFSQRNLAATITSWSDEEPRGSSGR